MSCSPPSPEHPSTPSACPWQTQIHSGTNERFHEGSQPGRCSDLISWTEEEVEQKREGLLATAHIQGHPRCQALLSMLRFQYFTQIRLFNVESSLQQNSSQPPLTDKATKAQRCVDPSVGHTAIGSGARRKGWWSASPCSLPPLQPCHLLSSSHAQSKPKTWKDP